MKTCLIEVGHWQASGYAAQLKASPHELAAVSDRDAARAEAFAKQYGARAYADHHEMLARERPDFVMALGRHCGMTRIADDLVEAGVPFLMEKPMGTDWQALARVADKAEAKGLYAGVTLQYRLSPVVRELTQRMEAGRLGRLVSYYFRLFAGGPERYHQWGVPWVLSKRDAGGGPLYNFGSHVIDLFLLFAAEPVTEVQCVKSHRLHGLDVEDFAAVTMTTTSGPIGVAQVG